eukprot:TRINITY_DN17402_c0_g1_i1.p1 TRINITY_DN17402_c0_g1~~TRINITY_DN17402_c0_g1_i1.p1  ORF type:complete len:578 (+),score=151.25 TRINITY_DN17402_c0_g1_i1:97-1734(+)
MAHRLRTLSSHLPVVSSRCVRGASTHGDVREDLAAAFRILYSWGMQDRIFNHLSASVPGKAGLFYTHRYGLLWNEVTAENLVTVSEEGELVAGEGPVERTASVLHSRIHAITGAPVVLHTHQLWATTLCVLAGEHAKLLQCHQNCMNFSERIIFDETYSGLAHHRDEGDRIAKLLEPVVKRGQGAVLMQANHGVFVCGNTVAEAVNDIYYLERAAMMQVTALQNGGRLAAIAPAATAGHVEGYVRTGQLARDAQSYFAALKSDPRHQVKRAADPHAAATAVFSAADTTSALSCTDVGDETWRARVDLAACYRALDRMGLNEGICNHLSATVPHPDKSGKMCFLMIPYGLRWDQVTASNLLLLDEDGKVLQGRGRAEDTAFFIHARIHAVTGRMCVLHTHQPGSATLSTLADGRVESRLHQTSTNFHDAVVYDDVYNGLVLGKEEGDRLASVMGSKKILLHRSHGLIVAEDSIAAAFHMMLTFEVAASLQLEAAKTRLPLRLMDADLAGRVNDARSGPNDRHSMRLHLEAVKRSLLADPASASFHV